MEELKSLAGVQLSALVWPPRRPKDKDNASFIEEFEIHIQTAFNKAPNEYAKEIQEFASLRNRCLSAFSDKAIRDQQSLKDIKKYYCQLVSILIRLRDSCAVFSWKDAFGSSCIEGGLDFELNNIMYNIAAIHNELGAKIPRTSESSAKEAISHFSSALWWVTELRDNRTGIKPKEMGHDLLTFFHHVLKAQAQENILAHSIKSGMNPELVAKICAQIATDYDVAVKLVQTPLYSDSLKDIILGSSVFSKWKATVTFKQNLFASIIQFLMGLTSRDDKAKEIGTRVARMRQASRLLDVAEKFVPDTFDPQNSKASFDIVKVLVTKNLEKAIMYNDSVYHSREPKIEELPEVEGKLLVSPAPFSVSSIPEFRDLFSSLVAIESVQATSIYSQEKDELARKIKADVEKRDEELAQMISTLNIEQKSLKLPTLETPDELMEICAELSLSPNVVDEVLTKLEELDDKTEEMQNLLDSAQEMLKKRPNTQLEAELRRYRTTHSDVLKTVQALHKQLYPELQREIQRLASANDPRALLPTIDKQSPESDEVLRKLERLLLKIEDMKKQRVQLLDGLKKSLDKDDVLQHVVTTSSEHELKSVFDKEIKKHDKYVNQLQQNFKMQDELLDTLERVNAQFGQVKIDYRSKQAAYSDKVESMKKFYIQFKAASNGINSGLDYYGKMLVIVKDFCRKIQADYDLHDLLN